MAADYIGLEASANPVLAEVMGPLAAAVGGEPHFRVNFSEAGPGIWLAGIERKYRDASAV